MNAFLERFVYPLARLERLIFPLAFAAGIIATVYWYWTTTPSYSVSQVISAIRHHDSDAFQKYVDIDSLASHAFDDVLEGPARGELLGRMDSMIGVGFIRFMKPSIVDIAHQKVVDVVADPKIAIDNPSDMSHDTLREHKIPMHVKQTLIDFGLTKYGFKGIKYLNIDGPNATLGLEFHSPKLKANYVIEFKMEDAGGYWRVTQVRNLGDLMQRYLAARSRA